LEITYKNRSPYNSGKAVVISIPQKIVDSFEEATGKNFKDLVFKLSISDNKLIYELQPEINYVPPTSKRYTDEFKIEVVTAAQQADNLSEVARKYGVSTTSISNWLSKHADNKTR